MPLSEHEQRILAEIEQQLAAEDPKFVARARRTRGRSRGFQLRLAVTIGLLGVVATLLLGFLPTPWNFVSGGVGLVMIFGAILLGATASSKGAEPDRVGVPPEERS
jgi:cytochrome c biogenesis protein CcdA